MPATPLPNADAQATAAGRLSNLTRSLRGIMPRTFQGRLTLGFISVVSLTLLLVGPAVIIQLDDYFLRQEQTNLQSRAASTNAVVALLANQFVDGQVVTPDDQVTPNATSAFTSPAMQTIANDAQADLTITVGTPTQTAGGVDSVVPAANGTFDVPLTAAAKRGQAREPMSATSDPIKFTGGVFTPWAIQVTLSNPYTYRASTLAAVTGVFVVVGILAFIVSVAVAAFLARRFTTPLRRLTTAARDLEQGELGSRVPTRLAATGAVEISELSRQFNAMADRLEESVAIIRRDRDRSRDFLADVSHELRTPITALRMGLVLLDLRPDDLRAAVESSVEQAQATVSRRGLKLRLSLPRNPVRIRHDPQRIGQVVTNLVGNAIKFTPRGGTVEVELLPDPDGARIVVRDSGVGIDPSELPHIFERFYRGTMANEARGSGSGLGLAIVKSIVDLHAGRITVDSQLGGGTTFAVVLPKDPRAVPDALGAPIASALVDEDSLDLPRPEIADSSPSAAS